MKRDATDRFLAKVKNTLKEHGFQIVTRYSPTHVKQDVKESGRGVTVTEFIGSVTVHVWRKASMPEVRKALCEYKEVAHLTTLDSITLQEHN